MYIEVMWRKTTSLEVYILRYPPMTEGYIFLPRAVTAVRPKVKKYNPRSEVDHLRIYTDKEVVLLYNFDFMSPPPTFFFRSTFSYSRVPVRFPPNERNNVNIQPCPIFTVLQWGYQPGTITNSTCLILTRLEVENSYFSMAFRRSFNPAINNSTNVVFLKMKNTVLVQKYVCV